jgi:hypothetical protein
MPLMPCAESPSAMAFTSSGCSTQKAAICSKVSDVLSTSQTAVAFGMSGAVAMQNPPLALPRLAAGKAVVRRRE